MKKSIQQSLKNDGNARLRALIQSNKSLMDELADVKLCNDMAISLYNLRIQKGVTQKELAKELGVKQSNISRWEKVGYQGYKLKMLSKIVRTLGGRLSVAINPSTYTLMSYLAFRQIDNNKIEVVSPEGWTVRQEFNSTREIVSVKVEGVGAEYATI